MQKNELKQCLIQLSKAILALCFCFEIILSYLGPAFAIENKINLVSYAYPSPTPTPTPTLTPMPTPTPTPTPTLTPATTPTPTPNCYNSENPDCTNIFTECNCSNPPYDPACYTCGYYPSPTPTLTPTPTSTPFVFPPLFKDIVSCSRTTAGLCAQVNAACSYRSTFTNEVFNGKCKNITSDGLTLCLCSITEDTAEGCTHLIGGLEAGACHIPDQECTYQGSGPDDPDKGKKGVCVTRQELNIDTLKQELKCRCNKEAVCGDEHIDEGQGEVCDPPHSTDGCEEWGGACSNDCRSCIPLPEPTPSSWI